MGTNCFLGTKKIILPNGRSFQKYDFGNANILLIPKDVFSQIKFLLEWYNHGKGNYEWTIEEKNQKFLL